MLSYFAYCTENSAKELGFTTKTVTSTLSSAVVTAAVMLGCFVFGSVIPLYASVLLFGVFATDAIIGMCGGLPKKQRPIVEYFSGEYM
jgi:hypothetical protein